MDLLNTIQNWSKDHLKNADTAHDYFHAQRVANTAQTLYLKNHHDPNELLFILVASYIHDCFDDKVVNSPEKNKSSLTSLLHQFGWPDEKIHHLFFIVEHLSFSKQLEKAQSLSYLGQIVQDADRLDALGAIGIARAFTFGGKHDALIYDPDILPQTELLNLEHYKSRKGTTINHFYEKLLTLKETMNTSEGKKLALNRTKYMESFLKEFFAEWEGNK